MNIGVIPARLASKRLPNKILADIHGKPMIIHTAERAIKAKQLERVILAIDSEKTENALKNYDFEMIMTSKNHTSGTDRVAEIARNIPEAEVILNIQADEPLIDPDIIDAIVRTFENKEVKMSTVVSTKLTVSDLLNPNVVKVIIDERKKALTFKRNIFDIEIGGVYRHIGIYGFCRETLLRFTMLSPTPREIKNNLEQLRALDNDISIHSVISSHQYYSVDTQDDLDNLSTIFNDSSKIINVENQNIERD
tara:strand:+ start:6063 stop:6815 length:753 start_codon:yes stop_codon:yes gene_type:complete